METEPLVFRPVEPSQPPPEGVEDPMDLFHAAIRSPVTRLDYEKWLSYFTEFAKTDPRELVRVGKTDPKRVEGKILAYVGDMKAKGLKPGTIRPRLAPIKLLLEMNDVAGINWKKIGKVIPPATVAEDRAPTVEEVRAIAGDSDHRLKVAVLFMATGGLRIGALAGMRVKHVEPIEAGGVRLARVKVYPGTKEEYAALVSPEAWGALESYLAHRRENGEKVTGESPVFRTRYKDGEAGKPVAPIKPTAKKRARRKELDIQPHAIQGLIEHRLRLLGLRKGEKDGKGERYEFAAAHGFRKFFKTRAETVMKPLNVELLLGHDTGMSGRYYRPREAEILEDYLKALPSLAILNPVAAPEVAEEMKELRERLAALEAQRAGMGARDGSAADVLESLNRVLRANPALAEAVKAELLGKKKA